MVSDNTRLTDAALWRMVMRIDNSGLAVLLSNTADSLERDVRTFSFDPTGGRRRLDQLTSVIYDNPLLLSDFGRVSVVVSTAYMAVIPAEAEGVAAQILQATADDAVIVDNLGIEGVKLAMKLPRDEVAFIRRTFPDADLRHRMSVMIDYFGARFTAGGNGRRLYAIVNADSVDIVVMDRRSLLQAVSHPISTQWMLHISSWLFSSSRTWMS